MAEIIIIEDHSPLLDTLTEGMSQAFPQLRVQGATQVEAVLDQFKTDPPKLVISDINLPGKSGVNFLAETRSRCPSVKFILMSAFASISKQEALRHGAVQFLKKPFPFKDLVNMAHDIVYGGKLGGNVEGLTLMDLMQTLHWGKRSSTIFITSKEVAGKICFFDGEVVHAETATERGVNAFRVFAQISRGFFEIKAAKGRPEQTTITESFSLLALDAMRVFDEDKNESYAQQLEPVDEFGENSQKESDPSCDDGSSGQVRQLQERLKRVCQSVSKKEADILAAGVIDLEKRVFLGVHHRIPQFADASQDAMAATIIRLFAGHEIARLASVHTSAHDSENPDLTTGVYLGFQRVSYFMKKLKSEQVIVVHITKNTTNQAFGWVYLQKFILRVKKALADTSPSPE